VSATNGDTPSTWRRVIDGSAILSTVRRALTGEFESSEDTRFAQATERGAQWLTGSALYQWLTAEPEPEVIVIDLRETWTVGPLLELLDRIITRVLPYWYTSRVSSGVDALVGLVERAAETRYGRAVASVLAPPEPPGSERRADPNGTESKATNQSDQSTAETESIEEPTADMDNGEDEDSHGRR
jgi:hypothetical protein